MATHDALSPHFTANDFNRLDTIPKKGRTRAAEILRSGELFRYSSRDPKQSDAYLLEQDLKGFAGQSYALAINSCTNAMLLALQAFGVGRGCRVLIPAFTFTAVPSAIVHLGADPILVECDENYKVDLEDLGRKADVANARFLLLSYMRGRIPDMDAIMSICKSRRLTLIEDAAHGMGGRWAGKPLGSFGRAAVYSFQSYKIVNCGEGGAITTNDEEATVKMILLHGAYEENYRKHGVESPFFAQYVNRLPLYNMRMTNYSAAIIRSQLPLIEGRKKMYEGNYRYLAGQLADCSRLELPKDAPAEDRVLDSIQFRTPSFDHDRARKFLELVKASGVPLAGFGADAGNARAPWNWHYVRNKGDLVQTRKHLGTAFDLRLPLSLTDEKLSYIADTFISSARAA